MKLYQRRVVVERDALAEKLERLREFLRTDTYRSLQPDEQGLLTRQHTAMTEYLAVLDERVALFDTTDGEGDEC